MPSSSQRKPDAGRYRSSRVHLPRSRLQHAERDGDGRRHRRRAPRSPRDPLRAVVPLRRDAPPLRHRARRPALGRSADRACAAAHVVRGARPDHGRSGARHRRRLEPPARHLGLRAAARQRLRERARPAAAGHARSRRSRSPTSSRTCSRARTSPIWMDSSTTEPVRRDRSGGRRPACARPPHRIARLRALHRTADPEVCRGRARRLRRDRSRPSRQLVARVAARRRARGDRPGRRLGHEPHGSGVEAVVAGARFAPRRRTSTTRLPPLAESWTVRRHALALLAAAATACRPRASWPGRATTPAASSAPASSAKASSRSRSARATRSSASCPRRARATMAPATSSPRRPAPTWA